MELWREKLDDQLLIPAGLVAGFCFAIKYTGFVAILYVMGVVIWKRKPKSLLPLVASAAVVALPWLIRNVITMENPVAPFFNRQFPNPYPRGLGRSLASLSTHLWNKRPLVNSVESYREGRFGGPNWADFSGTASGSYGLANRCRTSRCVRGVAVPAAVSAKYRYAVPDSGFAVLALAMAIGMERAVSHKVGYGGGRNHSRAFVAGRNPLL